MFRRAPVVFSPVELEYLKANYNEMSVDQLTIALAKSRSAIQKKIKEIKTGVSEVKKSNPKYQSKVGKREDIGIFVRSGWEANIIRWIKQGLSPFDADTLEYEPELFDFVSFIKRPKGAALHYLPDMKVTKDKQSYYLEVKGNLLRPTDKTKLNRFKKYYPEAFNRLAVVCGSRTSKPAEFFRSLGIPEANIIYYPEVARDFKNIVVGWE